MHGRIFQICDSPVDKCDYIDESNFYEGFVESIADYVGNTGANERDDNIDWLSHFLKDVEFEGDSFLITKDWLGKYREEKIAKVKKT